LLANLFADKAIELLVEGDGNRIVGLDKGKITSIGLKESCEKEKPLSLDLLALASVLST
jgi:hypothetical protein